MSAPPGGQRTRRFPLSLDRMGAPAKPSPARELLRPQAPLEQAARDRRQQSAPQGLGMDSLAVQRRMIERLQADGIRNPRLLQAFGTIPRHWFVDSALVNQAYEDTSLPIGLGQTISKPSVVARMMELLLGAEIARSAAGLGRVLEVGTGCGYQAALLALLSRRVVSIERLRDLHVKARINLDTLRQHLPEWPDVRLVYGDGMIGHAPLAPYDTIIAAAGGAALPQAWIDQLAPGGRLVAPLEEARGGTQVLTILDRLPDGSLQHSRAGAVLFVPLKSGTT